MSFGSPGYLLLLLGAGVIAGVIVWLEMWRRKARVAFGGQSLRRRAMRHLIQGSLMVTAAALIVLAAARPSWGTREFSQDRQGIDAVVVLDVSLSMTAQDVRPSRTAVAEDDVAHLVENLRGSRIGLVFFAGSAIVRSPLSTDTGALVQIVRSADRTASLTRAGSDLGQALDQAGRLLDASQAPGRAVILVSDGEDFGDGAIDKARGLRGRGIAVFVAGAGTSAGTTLLDPPLRPGGQPRLKIDPQTGQPVVTRLNEPNLQALAEVGGGSYVRLTGGGRDLLILRDKLAQLRQSPLSAETQRVPVERFQWFAAAALSLLACAWFVPNQLPSLSGLRLRLRRRRLEPGIALIALAILVGGACGGGKSIRERNASANQVFAAGDMAAALKAYETLLVSRPDLPELAYNAGNALDRAGKFDRAVAETQRALPPTRTSLGVATYYALGNHHLALGRLQDAFEAYRSALLLDPSDADSKYNLEIVLGRLRQQEPPNQGQGAPGESPDPGQNPDEQAMATSPAGEPQSGQAQPGTPGPANDPKRDLQQALEGLQNNLSFEDAIRILNLLDQLNSAQKGPGNQPSRNGGPDY